MRRTAVVLLAATGLCWAGGPALAAPGDPETGYWSRTRTGLPVPIQPPAPVPEGGTWVSGDPSGPVAVSALRAELAPGLVAVQLRLTVADAIGTPAVQACPTLDRWSPEQGGRLEAAPDADCSAPLDAVREGDVLVVPLPPGLPGVEVLLRPKPGSAFSITFERATAASVVTAPAPAPAPAVAPPPPPFLPPAPVAPPPGFASGVAPILELPAEAAAPLVAAPTLPQPMAAPPPVPAPQAAPVLVAAPVAARPASATDDRPQALMALAVLVLLGAQAVRLARQPAVAPRALGGSARRSGLTPALTTTAVPSRGVGRFRTERARPPVRL